MKFKDDIVAARFKDMHSQCQKLATDMDEWSVKHHGKEITITATVSTYSEDKLLERISDTHRTRRAFDVRVNDLTEDHIAELCAHFRKTWGLQGAVVSGRPSLIVFKPHGTGPHLHVQLARKFALSPLTY